MATSPTPTWSKHERLGAARELVEILSGPLPVLPPGRVTDVAYELRRMATERAARVWRHPGWGSIVGWVVRRVPDCDPTLAATHAVRRAPLGDPGRPEALRLASFLVRVASRSPIERPSLHPPLPLLWDPPEPEPVRRREGSSLSVEAAELLRAAGVKVSAEAWQLISISVDVAVDWWVDLASQGGFSGDALLVAARDAEHTTERWRLRRHFDGSAARPLVGLLVGGDQWGRRAREVAGGEVGLVYWALLARHARAVGEQLPAPPPAVVRAWATTVALVEKALVPERDGVRQQMGPTVAA
jgi:hypothetical protein